MLEHFAWRNAFILKVLKLPRGSRRDLSTLSDRLSLVTDRRPLIPDVGGVSREGML